MEQRTPNKDELKLIIDNALLEQEKRITKSLNDSLATQNETYLQHIVDMNGRLTKVEVKTSQFKGLVAGAASASAVISGLITFLITQLMK